MGTLTPTVATMHRRLNIESFGTPILVNASQCVLMSNMSFENGGICNLGRNGIYGEILCPAGQLSVMDKKFKVFSTPRIVVDQADEEEVLETEVNEVRNLACYRFHTEGGGLVKVSVGKESSNYIVFIEVSPMRLDVRKLTLNWRFSNLPIDLDVLTTRSESKPKEKTFKRISSGSYTLDLKFKAEETPFNLSFLLQAYDNAVIRTHRKTSFCIPCWFHERQSISAWTFLRKRWFNELLSLFKICRQCDSMSL